MMAEEQLQPIGQQQLWEELLLEQLQPTDQQQELWGEPQW